ncbi:MAG: type IV pilus twitching motility protein PilT [Clostridiales bacterium]|nr:type IV pilus twitching motility protein PilT [Clostridiales bacterium]
MIFLQTDGFGYLSDLLDRTNETRATDLHICVGERPLCRVNGALRPIDDTVITPPLAAAVVSALLDADQRERLARERVVDFSFSRPGVGRFRVNVYSQRGTFAAAIRRLPFDIPAFSELGLPGAVLSFTGRTKGLILATGATGSGKSTTLASLLDAINSRHNRHIITIEDPIEYLHKHKKSLVTQREIGADALSFPQALRSALREDPDVIMVGEMRDMETISIALTAAETGHLVLSTLHTVGAAKSIDRILDAFPPAAQAQVRSQLATVLEGIVSQMLLPRLDGGGLIAACEVMTVNTAVRNLIREGKHYQINSVIQTGAAQGMTMMEDSLARLIKSGAISAEDASLHAPDPALLSKLLGGNNTKTI